jgi:hypothetical protein
MSETMKSPTIFRPVREWPYLIGSNQTVWSESRIVRCRGGSKRTIAARQIKPSAGWVSLSREGDKRNFRVADLFAREFPELAHPKCQVECRKGHPLMLPEHELLQQWWTLEPAIQYWGLANRICAHCHPELPEFDKGSYSREWGMG